MSEMTMTIKLYHHNLWIISFFTFLSFFSGEYVKGDSLDTDKQVLVRMKSFLEGQNKFSKGSYYSQWNISDPSPCNWPGISCDTNQSRVIGINLSGDALVGDFFTEFSSLTQLSYLDLSMNMFGGSISVDLGQCQNLKVLNLSHNLIDGNLNLTGLHTLQVLDLSHNNRISGDIRYAIPSLCNNLLVANLSGNSFSGDAAAAFSGCSNLRYLDLSTNNLTGELWPGFSGLLELSLSENQFYGNVSSSLFTPNCSLHALDLSENQLSGWFPKEISNCRDLELLDLWGNGFKGVIPQEIGTISGLQALYLGSNNFFKDIPLSLLGLSELTILDLSANNFRGDIQDIFGKFKQIKFLILYGNSYTGGLYSSGILSLPNISQLDLSYNYLSGTLPVQVSQMPSLKFLILAYNQFTGEIPWEYGSFQGIQAIDLSFNSLNGSIPSSMGNLSSLLWLMLANNSLSGQIPPELGKCNSLLWLNLAGNQLSGTIPPQLTNIGVLPTPTFLLNRKDGPGPGSMDCLAMKRWIPADYVPFLFVYKILSRKNCISLWQKLLTGYGLFPVCIPGTNIRTFEISGYLQLSSNQLTGVVPLEIGNMHNFSMLHLGMNHFYGELPSTLVSMSLVVLNLTHNDFSGEIPTQIGAIKCMLNLDFSYNNFSGTFPTSLNNLTDLSKFNVSYNPYIYGVIPSTGQLSTFEKWSFLGDPLLHLPAFIDNTTGTIPSGSGDGENNKGNRRKAKLGGFLVLIVLILAFFVLGVMALIVCLILKSPINRPGVYLMEGMKERHDQVSMRMTSSASSSYSSSPPWLSKSIKVIRLDKTAFTHTDIVTATSNFSEDRIIGRGGYGTVYKGVLPDGSGREVAVKKLLREGAEGEKEFHAEMEVLSGKGFGWPHPNLVTLYGWCLNGPEKLLVYEYMEGGSLEEVITDKTKLTWKRRIEVALDVARGLAFLHHECQPCIVHRDVKASNVLLDKNGKARVTDFGLARVIIAEGSHVSTMVAGTVGYVAPEYGQIWHATTKGDVYSYGVLVMELATARRAVDGGEEDECLVEWVKRVIRDGRHGFMRSLSSSTSSEGGVELMFELLRIGIRCTAETPQLRPNMKEVLAMLLNISGSRSRRGITYGSSPPSL